MAIKVKSTKDIEHWLPIPEFNFEYSISTLGRIFSYKRGIYLKLKNDSKSYADVRLCREGLATRHLLHRLMWSVFKGNIAKGLVVMHRNNDKQDNRLFNLRLGTQKENLQQMSTEGRQHLQKLTKEDVLAIRAHHARIPSVNKSWLGLKYGVTCATICKVIQRQTFRSI